MGKWQQPSDKTATFLRLGELALRAQRLTLSERLIRLNALINSHTRTLKKQPGGLEKLDQVKQHVAEAQRLLRGKPNE